MTKGNSINLTWNELWCLALSVDCNPERSPYENEIASKVLNYSSGKSGPINIVEEEFIQADISEFVPKLPEEELRCQEDTWTGPDLERYTGLKCGALATYRSGENLLCTECSMSYTEVEEL